jgi:hypothetical protein
MQNSGINRFNEMQNEMSDPARVQIKCASGQIRSEMENYKIHIAYNIKMGQFLLPILTSLVYAT